MIRNVNRAAGGADNGNVHSLHAGTRYAMRARGEVGEIWLYDEIGDGFFGGVSANGFRDDLKALGEVTKINLYVNSPGGSVFEAVAIYNQLTRHKADVTVHIDGLAASAASIVTMAGDTIRIAENATIMIHDPWGMAIGDAEEMRAMAETLDKVRGTLVDTYVARTGGDRVRISDMMSAETWLTAAEALDLGFADELIEAKRIAAHVDIGKFKYRHPPEAVAKPPAAARPDLAAFKVRTDHMAERISRLGKGRAEG